MPLISLLRWWYGRGWRDQYDLVRNRLAAVADFFSISQSARTLFSPFKQIDAGSAGQGSIDVLLRAWFDNLFSRVFGAVLRSILILVGCLVLVVEALFGILRLAGWPLVPFGPFVMAPLTMIGAA